jgi:hypothetical protein
VPFLFLARAFEACGETTGRLEISATVANALRTIIATTPADLLPAVYLSSCSVAPQYEGVDLGVGEATLLKALAESTGRAEEFIKTAMATDGDLGIVAMKCRATQRTMFPMPILTVRGVFGTLREIAKTQGAKASERKRGLIKKLLVSARDIEAGYIMRMLQGKLGVGIAQQTVITALSHAALLQEHAAASATKDATALSVLSGTPLADQLSEADAVLRQVYSECPTWDLIVPALLSNGVMALPTTCHFVPGIPIKPMLAKATRGACACAAVRGMLMLSTCPPGVAEIVERFADVEFTCEYKYDGERAQVSRVAAPDCAPGTEATRPADSRAGQRGGARLLAQPGGQHGQVPRHRDHLQGAPEARGALGGAGCGGGGVRPRHQEDPAVPSALHARQEGRVGRGRQSAGASALRRACSRRCTPGLCCLTACGPSGLSFRLRLPVCGWSHTSA